MLTCLKLNQEVLCTMKWAEMTAENIQKFLVKAGNLERFLAALRQRFSRFLAILIFTDKYRQKLLITPTLTILQNPAPTPISKIKSNFFDIRQN